MRKWSWRFCNSVWRGEGWPEIWKKRMMVPVVKKSQGEVVGDYRAVTSTLYKMYTSVLTERLRIEMEEKGVIPHNQTGFRKRVETVDNIYVLNYVINRQVEKKGKSW